MTRVDEDIKVDVVDQLYWDDRVDANNVTVEVNANIVTLRGTVPTYLARASANEDAWAVDGVISVLNEIEVTHPPSYSAPSDDDIRADAEQRLALDASIDITDLIVSVEVGIVTLEGSVDALWKKLYAEDLVAYLPGVLAVDNKLAIVPTKDFVDQDIASDITAALERNALVDPEQVNVEVANGAVSLAGTVDSWAARKAAERAAILTPGVREVKNDVIIAPSKERTYA